MLCFAFGVKVPLGRFKVMFESVHLLGPPFFVPDEQLHSLFGEYYEK